MDPRERARGYTAESRDWLGRAVAGPSDVDDGVLFAVCSTAAATIAVAYANLAGLAVVAGELFEPEGYGDNWRPHASSCGIPTVGTERCGLLAGHAGRHLSWPSGKPFPADVHADGLEYDLTEARAELERRAVHIENQRHAIDAYVAAIEQLNRDLRDRSNEAELERARASAARHELEELTAKADGMAAELERRGESGRVEADGSYVYELPGAPVVGRIVQPILGSTDAEGRPFVNASLAYRRNRDGNFVEVTLVKDRYGETVLPEPWTWAGLLGLYGRLRLVPLTAEEEATAKLYGPIGERWGDVSQPCPYVGELSTTDNGQGLEPYGPCSLRVGHTGPHVDSQGRPMGQTTVDPDAPVVGVGYRLEGDPVDIELPDGRIVPGVLPADRCTCGHPEQHRPGCPRYSRVSGGTFTQDD
jgi:hypothetical protein